MQQAPGALIGYPWLMPPQGLPRMPHFPNYGGMMGVHHLYALAQALPPHLLPIPLMPPMLPSMLPPMPLQPLQHVCVPLMPGAGHPALPYGMPPQCAPYLAGPGGGAFPPPVMVYY